MTHSFFPHFSSAKWKLHSAEVQPRIQCSLFHQLPVKRCGTSIWGAGHQLNVAEAESEARKVKSGEFFLHLTHAYRTESTQAWQAKNTGVPAALTSVHKPESASQERKAKKSRSSCSIAQWSVCEAVSFWEKWATELVPNSRAVA